MEHQPLGRVFDQGGRLHPAGFSLLLAFARGGRRPTSASPLHQFDRFPLDEITLDRARAWRTWRLKTVVASTVNREQEVLLWPTAR